MSKAKVNVIVIGAGPSGCVAAAYLRKNGISVNIVEKSFFPRFVIGESLLPRCMDHFEEVGLLPYLETGNFEIKKGARFIKDEAVCEFDFSQKHTLGWDWTWQVPRADFDMLLADGLQDMGVEIAFGHSVEGVSFTNNTAEVTLCDNNGLKTVMESDFVIDCSGYGRVLSRLLNLEKPSKLPKHSSIFTHVKDEKRPVGEKGSLISFDVLDTQSWLWVIPFSNGITSIGFVAPTAQLDSLKGNKEEKLRQLVASSDFFKDRFNDIPYLFEPREMKNYSKSVKQLHGERYVLAGNSAEFLDPIFSSGVTFATESALLAGKLTLKELKGKKVDWDKEYTNYMSEGIDVFSSYVKEWYTGNLQKLFFHKPENPIIKKQICSVLAGYVWDQTNPFVTKHDRLIKSVAHLIDMEMGQKEGV